jgi:hypothetical protein
MEFVQRSYLNWKIISKDKIKELITYFQHFSDLVSLKFPGGSLLRDFVVPIIIVYSLQVVIHLSDVAMVLLGFCTLGFCSSLRYSFYFFYFNMFSHLDPELRQKRNYPTLPQDAITDAVPLSDADKKAAQDFEKLIGRKISTKNFHIILTLQMNK